MARPKASQAKPAAPAPVGPVVTVTKTDFVRMGPLYLCKECADIEGFPYKRETITKLGARVVVDGMIPCSKCLKELT